MVEVLYQGKTYDAYPVQDATTAQITGYQLIGYEGYPYGRVVPASQVQVIGNSGNNSGPVSSPSPPANPVNGQVWQNTSSGTVSGVAPNHWAIWNGTGWIDVGTTLPNSGGVISSPTAPVGPQPGAVWFNSSGGTVSGVASNHYGVWNGTSWVDVGTSVPLSGTAGTAGVSSLNALTGAVALVEGTGIDITQNGNQITITSTGVGEGTPGVSSLNGLAGALTIAGAGGNTVGAAGSTITITAPSSAGGVTSFNSRSGAVTPQNGDYTAAQVGADPAGTAAAAIASHNSNPDPHSQYLQPTEVFGGTYLAQATAPSSPVVGQIWRNTNASTVSGVPSGNYAVWNGSAWVDKGASTPFEALPYSGGAVPSSFGQNTVLAGPVSGGAGPGTVRLLTTADLPTVGLNPTFYATGGTLQAALDTTFTKLVADTEEADTQGTYDPAQSRATIVTKGLYLVGTTALIDATTGYTLSFAAAQFYKNGVIDKGLPGMTLNVQQQVLSGEVIMLLEPGDYIEVFYIATSTATSVALTNKEFYGVLITELPE